MTYEEFVEIAGDACAECEGHDEYRTEERFDGENLSLTWCTGGMEGGNCWGDEPRSFSGAESDPSFFSLDELLKRVAPNITYLSYREMSRLIVETEWTDREYYGNYTEYATRKMPLKGLWEFLKNEGVI